ncbi:MAG: PEP-CTERM sorting domain-containing protein [Opitutales bacterium]|nr:PEP-CTERM sorting domain-containing protein [Opitutales bacterium]
MLTIVFQDWVTSDDMQRSAQLDPQLAISINGGPDTSLSAVLYDNYATNTSDIGPNDGFIYIFPYSVGSVSSGGTVTLLAGNYTIAATSGFNPGVTQSFSGNMFITDTYGVRISDIVAIPEPSAYAAVFGATGLALLLRRRARR